MSGLVRVDLSEGQVNVRPSTYLVNVDMPEVVARVGVIAGQQGAVVTHPNTDDVSVQVWDAGMGRLQRVWYDSGWRNVATLVNPAFNAVGTGLQLQLRRIGFQCNLAFRVEVVSSTDPRYTRLPLIQMPSGFVPMQNGVLGPVIVGTGATSDAATAKDATATAGVASNFQLQGRVDVSSPGISIPYAPGDIISGVVVFQTGKTLPTTLPGTLANPAPE